MVRNFIILDTANKKYILNETLLMNIQRLILLSRGHKSAYTKATKLLTTLIGTINKHDKIDTLEQLDERIKEVKASRASQINNPKDKQFKKNKAMLSILLGKDDNEEDEPSDDKWAKIQARSKKMVAEFGKINTRDDKVREKAVETEAKQEKKPKRHTPEEFIGLLREKLPFNQSLQQLILDKKMRGGKTKLLLATFNQGLADKTVKMCIGKQYYRHEKFYIREEGKHLHLIRIPIIS